MPICRAADAPVPSEIKARELCYYRCIVRQGQQTALDPATGFAIFLPAGKMNAKLKMPKFKDGWRGSDANS
jgi:hypothetical protein